MADPLTDIPKLEAPRDVKASDKTVPRDEPKNAFDEQEPNDDGEQSPSDRQGGGVNDGDDGDDGDDSGSDESGDLEEEGGEEEDEEEDVPPLDTLIDQLADAKEQIKDLTTVKWKIEEQIVEHYPDSKEAKSINRRWNGNTSRANVSEAVAEFKNTLITLYVKKDDNITEDFKVRLSMSGGKFIQMVADRFNVKKSKFYLTCPNGDLLQAGNRVLINQKLKPDDILSISFCGGGGAKRVKTEMKAEHKVARLQAKLRADNRQCDDTEVDAVVIALEGVKKYLADGVNVQQLLTDAPLDALKAVLALTPKGETGRATMNKLEDVAKQLLPPLKQLGDEISTVKDIYADVFHIFLDDYANRYNSTKTKDATLNHRDFIKAVEDIIAYKEQVAMSHQKTTLEQKLRGEFEAKLQQHLASVAKPSAPNADGNGDVKMG